MLVEIKDAIIERLKEIPEAITVETWQGEEDLILQQAQKLPALWVIYQRASFSEKKLIGNLRADHIMSFQIILIIKNLQSRKAGADQCYELIESVREKLVGYQILDYGWLWPVNEELIFAENGFLGYGLEYRLQTYTR